MACPISTNSKYRLIEGTCYYFEATKMDYSTAENNCKNKFGLSGGKLAEPRSVSTNNKIYAASLEFIAGYYLWIGVTDRRTTGRYSYNSDITGKSLSEALLLAEHVEN